MPPVIKEHECSVCGYVCDPGEHDGVVFEDLPVQAGRAEV